MARTNKSALCRQYLLAKGSITSWEAIENFSETRLADVIFRLRKAGYDIKTDKILFTDRYGNHGSYAKYTIENLNT